MSFGRWAVRGKGKHIVRCQAEARYAPSPIHKTSSCRLGSALPCTKMPPQLQGLRQSDTWDRHGSFRDAGAWLAMTVYHLRLRVLWLPGLLLQ